MEGPMASDSAISNNPSPRSNRRRGNHHRTQPQIQPQQQRPRTGPNRTFGGQLTRLQADALPFVPASLPPQAASSDAVSVTSSPSHSNRRRNNVTRPTAPHRPNRTARKASISRSTAPDIATRTHEDISNNVYECAICTNEISRNSKVWSCRTCWTVFHIGCIKKWSQNEGSAVARQPNQSDDEAPSGRLWRCPGCNLPKDTLPSAYTCWCEKELDPKPLPGLPPHSCGQTCGRGRKFPKTCPHPCDLICHAGPCPPCSAMGPRQSCYCGKQETSRRCTETNYESGWSCREPCGDLMPCGQHTCDRPCHEGLCGACTVQVEARCYCGKVRKALPCNQTEEEKESHDGNGVFDCHQICDRPLDCGIHHCEQYCHPQDLEEPHCPRSADAVSHCPCGKTSLIELNLGPRQLCTDPIPNCSKPCGKALKCGHECLQVCHAGECLACLLDVEKPCRCGRNTFTTVCHRASIEPPQCSRVCKATLNCGRHECGEKCCPGEKRAAERQATKRKLKPLGSVIRALDEGIEAEHICTRVCGRPLKCGNHSCQELCHKGPCLSCKEAIFDDIACNCGRTVLQAPLPCGTRPPPCNFPCQQPKSCGHPQVPHNCHASDEPCPKCPFLTEKECLCGKKMLKNQPCWRSDVLCGLVCGKLLKCGSHTCQKTCHRTGECEDALQHCQQECGKPKKTCGHPCEQPCHAPSMCKEDKPCPFKVMITCDCQRRKEEVRCNARANIPEPPGRQTSLKCDDECARLERNRNLALALHIADDHTDDHVPYSTTTLNMYLEDIAWAHRQEEVLRIFAADENEKRYRFKPMKPRQRAFIHSVAEDFGFDGESLDPEPHRHVLLFKTPKFVSAPMKTLAQAARIRRAQLNISAPIVPTISISNHDKRANETVVKHEYNGLLLTNPRFALTEDELLPILRRAAPTTEFNIIFLSSNEGIALFPFATQSQTPEQVRTLLSSLQPTIIMEVVQKHNFASSVVLTHFDTSLSLPEPRILHRQDLNPVSSTISTTMNTSATSGGSGGGGGWSQVAAKKAPAMQAPQVEPVGQRPIYTVLGSRLAEVKKTKIENEKNLKKLVQKAQKQKQKEEEVVDDWEAEAEKEEMETGLGAGSVIRNGAEDVETENNENDMKGDGEGGIEINSH